MVLKIKRKNYRLSSFISSKACADVALQWLGILHEAKCSVHNSCNSR